MSEARAALEDLLGRAWIVCEDPDLHTRCIVDHAKTRLIDSSPRSFKNLRHGFSCSLETPSFLVDDVEMATMAH